MTNHKLHQIELIRAIQEKHQILGYSLKNTNYWRSQSLGYAQSPFLLIMNDEWKELEIYLANSP
jgi:hypothetical protein